MTASHGPLSTLESTHFASQMNSPHSHTRLSTLICKLAMRNQLWMNSSLETTTQQWLWLAIDFFFFTKLCFYFLRLFFFFFEIQTWLWYSLSYLVLHNLITQHTYLQVYLVLLYSLSCFSFIVRECYIKFGNIETRSSAQSAKYSFS